MQNQSRSLRVGLACAVAGTSLAGCALSPAQIQTASVTELCGYYAASLHPNFFDPAIKSELEKRGAAGCTDPAVVNARVNASMGLMQQGSAMMSAAQSGGSFPTYAAPPARSASSPQQDSGAFPSAPTAPTINARKLGEEVTGTTKQCIYGWGSSVWTHTVNKFDFCPLTLAVER